MAQLHSSAIVDPKAQLGGDVRVGPFSIIGAGVRVGEGTEIGSHVVLAGNTTIGRNNRIFPHSSIGTIPQDKKYAGEDTQLIIGDGNTIREFCLINTGTLQGGGVTRIGSDNWIMGYTHFAHDCTIGSHTIIANGVQLAGHVRVDDWVVIGGTAVVHQFVRLGAHSMCGGASVLVQDLPPFTVCSGYPARPHGVHVEGLKRREFPPESVAALRQAYRIVYRENRALAEALLALEALIRELPDACAAPVRTFVEFLAAPGRGIIR
ncbi:MAG TPA: acyl-ACP--UDP-N-acetylglucosamine O-acyltransferase [Burkholderiaceae bacterium]|nr:acyl-ACP--UDP-N-acetylglucosamine O-acyltransferase [Burkholderiaceae bacterium]